VHYIRPELPELVQQRRPVTRDQRIECEVGSSFHVEGSFASLNLTTRHTADRFGMRPWARVDTEEWQLAAARKILELATR
jgi:hypothetical protein